jgi:hypothetical protein
MDAFGADYPRPDGTCIRDYIRRDYRRPNYLGFGSGLSSVAETYNDRVRIDKLKRVPSDVSERRRAEHGLRRHAERQALLLEMLPELEKTMGIMPGTTICGLADGTAWATRTFINKFYDEFAAQCPEEPPATRVPLTIKRGTHNVATPMGFNTR